MGDLILTITGDSFNSYNTIPFFFNGNLSIDWGDGTTETYTEGKLSHTYNISDEYEIVISGNILAIRNESFKKCNTIQSAIIDVPEIYKSGFQECNNLSKVTFSSNVTFIGDSSFFRCNNLSELKFESNTPPSVGSSFSNGIPSSCVIKVPKGFLSSYTSASNYPNPNTYTYVEYPESALVLTVTGSSFSSYNSSPFTYTGTVTIDWGDGNTETYTGGQLSHNYSSSGTYDITITGNITSLNEGGFRQDQDQNRTLVNVIIPDGVTSIGNMCFYYCTNLTSVTIPEGVTTIGINSFYNCTKLSSIIIPSTTSQIGGGCFGSCNKLSDITFKSVVPPTFDIFAFRTHLQGEGVVHIPKGSLNDYTSASNCPDPNIYAYVECDPSPTSTGIFDDARSVVIHNKEVQSIITEDNGTLYARPSVNLTASSDTVEQGEILNIQATVDGGTWETIGSGQLVQFYKE